MSTLQYKIFNPETEYTEYKEYTNDNEGRRLAYAVTHGDLIEDPNPNTEYPPAVPEDALFAARVQRVRSDKKGEFKDYGVRQPVKLFSSQAQAKQWAFPAANKRIAASLKEAAKIEAHTKRREAIAFSDKLMQALNTGVYPGELTLLAKELAEDEHEIEAIKAVELGNIHNQDNWMTLRSMAERLKARP